MTHEIALAVLSAVFAAGGAYAAVRVELRFVWRDLNDTRARLRALERRAQHAER